MSPSRTFQEIQKVCVIGAGPAGVAAAKALLAENHFLTIDVFEQRSNVGGVWNYEPENYDHSRFDVPRVNPDVPLEKPVWRENGRGKRATYQSPMYKRLEANLPKMLMQHSDLPFPSETQLFPMHGEILEYLERYARDIKHMITFETQVVNLVLGEATLSWQVTTDDLRSGSKATLIYDAVIVASGHYQIPFIPPYQGIVDFNEKYSGVITHSKNFDSPEHFRNKTVLVIGYGPSGIDIATQIASTCKQPLHISTRSGTPSYLPTNARHHPAITKFSSEQSNRAVQFSDGTVLGNIDAILFCTGYLYSYPFIDSNLRTILDPPSMDLRAHKGSRLHGTYQQIFFTPHPTLSFLTLPWNIVPFPVAEAQAAAIARVYSGRLALPSEERCWAWEHSWEAREGIGKGKGFHRLATPRDVDYINDLWQWCQEAEPAPKFTNGDAAPDTLHDFADPLDVQVAADRKAVTIGKEPPYWDHYMRWLRLTVPEIKKAFADRGSERHAVRTLEELGFMYSGPEK